ncbi:MAG TPA: transposase [Pyrinomonadaceae bacterium]|nr:transposase [Pyrinomonadaceae bacterium]
MIQKFQISRDTQALFITITSKDRLTVFKSDAMKTILCGAINEARTSGGFLIFSYVIMPDHLHLITNEPKSSADVLRYLKGISARRVIDYLKEGGYESSLTKLRHEDWGRDHRYSLWQQEKNVFSIFSEKVFMQKVNYIHLNPVRAGFVERAVDYHWSSARIWQRCELEEEPLLMDIDRIQWRRGRSPRLD